MGTHGALRGLGAHSRASWPERRPARHLPPSGQPPETKSNPAQASGPRGVSVSKGHSGFFQGEVLIGKGQL